MVSGSSGRSRRRLIIARYRDRLVEFKFHVYSSRSLSDPKRVFEVCEKSIAFIVFDNP